MPDGENSHTTCPKRIRTKLSSKTTPIPQPAKSEHFALKTSIGKESPAGRINSSHPGKSSAARQHKKLFLGFG